MLSNAEGLPPTQYNQRRLDNIERNDNFLLEIGLEPKKPPAVKVLGMRVRPKKVEKEEELYIGRLVYKALNAGCCGISHAEPLFKYLKYVFFDKVDKFNTLVENVCSATVECKEILFFQHRVQGRRNRRLEYTPCAEMLDESAASEWEITTVPLPSIPAGEVQNSNNKTPNLVEKKKVAASIVTAAPADKVIVAASCKLIKKVGRLAHIVLSSEEHATCCTPRCSCKPHDAC